MGDQVKKISFGFSKLAKKTTIVPSSLNKNNQDDVNKVELIDCLEGKSIKLKDPVKQDQGPLIIPLIKQNAEKISNQQFNSQNLEIDGSKHELHNDSRKDSSVLVNEENGKHDKTDNLNENKGQIKHETLDEVAAREILEELKRKNTDDDEKRVFSVPLTSNAPTGEKESTLEDYDSIPVNAFGMAMLRGMGWAPGKGIGKTEKLVTPTLPTPRPKGMGLGADKVIKSVDKKNSNEELKMVKGSYVRVLAGPEKDAYGEIEGFDDESGRLIVKLALKNVSVSLNEFIVQLVDTNEFKKNSKVINVSKYERYKEEEVKKESSGKIVKEEEHEKTHREPVSENQERSYDKSKGLNEKISRSFESKERNLKVKKVESHSDMYMSRDTTHNKNKSNRPNDSNGRKRPSSPSRSRKYQSTKDEFSSKYSNKSLSSHDKKGRSHSSDSSDSSRSYRTTNKKSSKAKSPLNDRSVRRRRSSSNSSDSSENYSRKKKNKHKKKSSSSKYRSRSRSRSPRKHKHKKREKFSNH